MWPSRTTADSNANSSIVYSLWIIILSRLKTRKRLKIRKSYRWPKSNKMISLKNNETSQSTISRRVKFNGSISNWLISTMRRKSGSHLVWRYISTYGKLTYFDPNYLWLADNFEVIVAGNEFSPERMSLLSFLLFFPWIIIFFPSKTFQRDKAVSFVWT